MMTSTDNIYTIPLKHKMNAMCFNTFAAQERDCECIVVLAD